MNAIIKKIKVALEKEKALYLSKENTLHGPAYSERCTHKAEAMEEAIKIIDSVLADEKKKIEKVPTKIHPDTFEKPYFVIVPSHVPDHGMLEQLYKVDGSKCQIEGEDVHLVIRKEEISDISLLTIPIEIMNFLRGKSHYDEIDYEGMSPLLLKQYLEMSKLAKKYFKKK